jgi:hypothetical protein
MAAGTVKLGLYNALAESETWDVDPVGINKPPPVSLQLGVIDNYTNIAAGADHLALLSDGDQNLPVITSGGGGLLRFEWDFGAGGANYRPELIAILNHNCFEAGDFINIVSGPASPAANLRLRIQAPNRSVDLFYPLRFNDCWYNSTAITDRYWAVVLSKASGLPYVGEIFFTDQYFSYEEWDPQPRWPATFDYQKNAAIVELQSGSLFDYEIEPPFVNIGLDWGRKAEGATDKFLEHQINTICAAASHSPYKQVLVLYEDRVCVFGRLEPNGSYQELSDGSFSPSHRFIAEYPRKFFRSGLVA